MPASYPASVKSFGPAHQDFTENILAAHVNDVQDEVVAIESMLGTTPQQGGTLVGGTTTYATLKARLDALMDAVRTHTHDGTSGVKLVQANTHQSPDTDAAPGSLHHTLGPGANQAATGNHGHGEATAANLNAHTAATAAHGATGAVVGTTNTQTLQNKTLDGTNTFPSTLATLTGTQTLTNKTLSGASNTFSAIPSSAVTGLDGHTAATAAHGATGAVVGTTGAQTLSSKTLSNPTINSANLTGTMNGGSISTNGIGTSGLTMANGGGEITLGYGGTGGLAIAQGNVTSHVNGVVLWVSGQTLLARKANGTDVGVA